jgi:hypothetical protein
MKTTRILALLMGMIATLAIFSCKKTDISRNETSEEVTGQRIVLVTDGELPQCATTCINPAGPYIESTGSNTQRWGNPSNPQHWKTVGYVAYNTPTSFVVKVTFTQSGGNASNTVSVSALGSTQSIETLASGATHTFTFNLPATWNACYEVPFSIYQEGQNIPINMACSYSLYAVCPEDKGCETSFVGQAVSCGTEREAVYTFTSEDATSYFKMQGGLTNFTGADAIVEVSGGTGIATSQWAVGGSTNRVIKIEGSIGECEVISIRIRWNSTNSGGVITGDWSVKDANGVDIVPSVAGLTCN